MYRTQNSAAFPVQITWRFGVNMAYYYCIENQQLVSILDYEPNVPDSVTVVDISTEHHFKIQNREWCFDVDQKRAVPMPAQRIQQIAVDQQNQDSRAFLDSTDWKILRHLRQQALGLPTSLTHDQYIELERQREDVACSITAD